MVYCQKCGAENADDADFCKKCGAPLTPVKSDTETKIDAWGKKVGRRAEAWGRRAGERMEEECFGITGGGAIFGVFIGIIIIGLGFTLVYGIPLWLLIGPTVGLIVGLLIIICALNAIRRKRSVRAQE